MAQAGCTELSLSFDFINLVPSVQSNAGGNGTSIWVDYSTQSNFWDPVNPTDGVYNFFAGLYQQNSTTYMHLYNGPILEDDVKHIDQNGGVNNYNYELYYFDSGVLTPFHPFNNGMVLAPQTYLIRVTSTQHTGDNGNPCVYNYSFVVNNNKTFIPITLGNDSWGNSWGCIDPNATNYFPSFNANNNGCDYDVVDDIPGCTSNTACNYEPNANIDDGSCDYTCYGCTDSNATNFSTTATIPCNGTFSFCVNINQPNCCCVYGDNEVFGCTDDFSPDFNSLATIEDGSCTYPTIGCTNPEADNFNPLYTEDDGTCSIGGCMDGLASNFSTSANFDNGTCIYDDCVYGCTEPSASNYKPSATCDDGSCYGGCCGTDSTGQYLITGFTQSKIDDIKFAGRAYSETCADPLCTDEVSCIGSGAGQCNSTWGYNNITVATTDPDITAKYGVNPYYPLKMRVPSLGITNGWTQITPGQVTAYTINNIFYWDYATDTDTNKYGNTPTTPVFTRFAVRMKNCCPGCLYPDIKEEWTMGHVFPPQIENNVFIDRGIASVFEEHYRITEINRLEDFDFYQGGYFNLID